LSKPPDLPTLAAHHSPSCRTALPLALTLGTSHNAAALLCSHRGAGLTLLAEPQGVGLQLPRGAEMVTGLAPGSLGYGLCRCLWRWPQGQRRGSMIMEGKSDNPPNAVALLISDCEQVAQRPG